MKNFFKNNFIFIILIILFLGLGILCLLVDGADIVRVFSYIVSGFLGLVAIILLILSFKNQSITYSKDDFLNGKISYLIQGIILLATVILSFIYPEYLVRILVGIILIIIPTLRLFFEVNKYEYFKRNFWKYIVGIVFIVASDKVLEAIFFAIGILFILLAIFAIYLLIKHYLSRDNSNIITKYVSKYLINKGKRK